MDLSRVFGKILWTGPVGTFGPRPTPARCGVDG
nr:MAG TPA: hypothetical protein [Caudoviricetes sp.]